ncbi:MAG: hypothetical protein WA659_01420 [Candidatus Aquirickettsiella sp.]
MPHTLSVRINPDCLSQIQYEKNVSEQQNTFIESVKDLHITVNQLKKQTDFRFNEKQKQEISRGGFYALTKSLEKKFTKQPPITLLDLQSALNEEFRIEDRSKIDFFIKSLLEPTSLPFALSALAFSVLPENCIWSNECATTDPAFKYALKAKSDSRRDNIIFKMPLNLKNPNFSVSSPQGSAQIQFMIQEKQIKLLPLYMKFNFVEKKALKEFKKKLCCDFRDWVFLPNSHWPTADLWVIPILLGCFLGLSAMISLLALSLTPISPLLLPALGFALGLGLASMMHSYVHICIKKEQKKWQRPIHILNKPMQTTAFFNHPDKVTVMSSEWNECSHPPQFRISPGLPRATRSQ